MAATKLKELEQLILAVLVKNGVRDDAYGLTIFDEVGENPGQQHSYSLGAVYIALDGLEKKGYVESRLGEATPERRGMRKLFFKITNSGELALKNARPEGT